MSLKLVGWDHCYIVIQAVRMVAFIHIYTPEIKVILAMVFASNGMVQSDLSILNGFHYPDYQFGFPFFRVRSFSSNINLSLKFFFYSFAARTIWNFFIFLQFVLFLTLAELRNLEL